MTTIEDTIQPMPTINQLDREGFAAFVLRMRKEGISDQKLMSAIEAVPRRGFVAPEYQSAAWGARTLPIECGEALEGLDLQARMINALQLENNHRVFEIGTGSGYTAAVLAHRVKRVYTIDRYRTLQRMAQHRFRQLQLNNIVTTHGDGTRTVSDGPFDRIICWAAFDAVPRIYLEHLVSGGMMVCAIGPADEPQTLMKLTKVGSRYDRDDLGMVRFQPLVSSLPAAL